MFWRFCSRIAAVLKRAASSLIILDRALTGRFYTELTIVYFLKKCAKFKLFHLIETAAFDKVLANTLIRDW